MSIVIRSWRQISSSRSIRKDLNGELWVNHYPMNNCKTMGTNVKAIGKSRLHSSAWLPEWLLSQTNILSCEAQKMKWCFSNSTEGGGYSQTPIQFGLASKFQPSVKVDHIWVFIHDLFLTCLAQWDWVPEWFRTEDVNIKDERGVACSAEGLYMLYNQELGFARASLVAQG